MIKTINVGKEKFFNGEYVAKLLDKIIKDLQSLREELEKKDEEKRDTEQSSSN